MRTTPVRWWRSEDERYRSRPPYVAPFVEDAPQWEVGPPDPALVAAFAAPAEAGRRAMLDLCAMPLDMLCGAGSCGLASGRALAGARPTVSEER